MAAKSYTVSEAGAKLPELLEEAASHPVSIVRDDKTVAFLIAAEDLETWFETQEILRNPEAMAAIERARSGKGVYYTSEDLDRMFGPLPDDDED